MNSDQVLDRMMAQRSGLPLEKILKRDLDKSDWQKLSSAGKELSESSIYIDDTPSLSLFELRSKAMRLKHTHNIQLIVVDYLQLMQDKDTTKQSREQEIASISRGLKVIAKELDVAVIVASQLSRAVEARGGDKRPLLSDLRESGAIEQDADMVIFLYRPDYYEISSHEEGVCEILIAKNRQGKTGRVRIYFDSAKVSFTDYVKQPTFTSSFEGKEPPKPIE